MGALAGLESLAARLERRAVMPEDMKAVLRGRAVVEVVLVATETVLAAT